MKGDFIQITWTAGSLDEARLACRYLVQERLVAHAHIIPWIESISMLDNQLDTNQESKINLIAPKAHLDTILAILKKNSHYQIPEIFWTSFEGANPDYLNWLNDTTTLSNKA